MTTKFKSKRLAKNKPKPNYNKPFKSEHNLDFEVAEYELNIDPENNWMRFRIGTCEGIWCSTKSSYDILGITNNSIGNGHFNDVIQWFERSCLRDRKDFRILEVWNGNFKEHLINKRGFVGVGENDVIKRF